MEWGAVIAGLVTLVGLLLKAWLTGAPERKKEADNATTQQGRADIVNGNVDAVSQRIDSVPPQPSNSPGLGNDQDTARRLAEITDK